MRLFCGLLFFLTLLSGTANAFQQCDGNPKLRVFWEQSVLQVGDTFYKMHMEKLGKKSRRLTGHEMIFVSSRDTSNVFVRGGSSKRYDCEKAQHQSAGLQTAQIIPYVANRFVAGSSDPALNSGKIDGTDKAANTSGKGHNGHGRGKGS